MSRKSRLFLGCIFLALLVAGCKKKAPAPVPPPAPAPAPAPTASLTASPASIERGNSATLVWSTANAQEVTIDPQLGSVSASGSRAVRPTDSTTYRLTAKGAGGSASASARVTVTVPPVAPERPRPRPTEESLDALWARQIKSIYFDYDRFDVRPDQRSALDGNADFLNAHRDVQVVVEGNCDERGSAKYNLGLGDKRANALKEYLVSKGIAASRLQTISYGKEKPVCKDANEDCWQKNRRGDTQRR